MPSSRRCGSAVLSHYFIVVEARIVGKTTIGRTTVWVCDMNTDKRVVIRRQLLAASLF